MGAARHLFDRVIGPRGLLSTRARLLVTHAIGFVPQCDHIIFLRDGRITEQGSYLALMGAGSDVNQLLSEIGYLGVYGLIGVGYAVLTLLYLTVLWGVCAVRYAIVVVVVWCEDSRRKIPKCRLVWTIF